MLDSTVISCPYCGEAIEILLDASVGEQQYIEDCQVCCRPISVTVALDTDGDAQASVRAEDDV